MVSYINELTSVDTSSVEPTSQTTGLENSLREDKAVANQSLSVDDVLYSAKKSEKGYFVVPIISKKG